MREREKKEAKRERELFPWPRHRVRLPTTFEPPHQPPGRATMCSRRSLSHRRGCQPASIVLFPRPPPRHHRRSKQPRATARTPPSRCSCAAFSATAPSLPRDHAPPPPRTSSSRNRASFGHAWGWPPPPLPSPLALLKPH